MKTKRKIRYSNIYSNKRKKNSIKRNKRYRKHQTKYNNKCGGKQCHKFENNDIICNTKPPETFNFPEPDYNNRFKLCQKYTENTGQISVALTCEQLKNIKMYVVDKNLLAPDEQNDVNHWDDIKTKIKRDSGNEGDTDLKKSLFLYSSPSAVVYSILQVIHENYNAAISNEIFTFLDKKTNSNRLEFIEEYKKMEEIEQLQKLSELNSCVNNFKSGMYGVMEIRFFDKSNTDEQFYRKTRSDSLTEKTLFLHGVSDSSWDTYNKELNTNIIDRDDMLNTILNNFVEQLKKGDVIKPFIEGEVIHNTNVDLYNNYQNKIIGDCIINVNSVTEVLPPFLKSKGVIDHGTCECHNGSRCIEAKLYTYYNKIIKPQYPNSYVKSYGCLWLGGGNIVDRNELNSKSWIQTPYAPTIKTASIAYNNILQMETDIKNIISKCEIFNISTGKELSLDTISDGFFTNPGCKLYGEMSPLKTKDIYMANHSLIEYLINIHLNTKYSAQHGEDITSIDGHETYFIHPSKGSNDYLDGIIKIPMRIAPILTHMAHPCPGCQLNFLAHKYNWETLDWDRDYCKISD